ncbi:MAG: transposase [Cypionkella sp.]
MGGRQNGSWLAWECRSAILLSFANSRQTRRRCRIVLTCGSSGIDEWAWRKGTTYGTVIVDLERRAVVELLPDRANASVAKWFSDHPEVEYISRDRAGVYADGARQGAPQARQGADRFHLLMNFRETVAREMNGIGPPIRENSSAGEDHEYQEQGYAAREQIVALTRRADRQAVFDEIRALYDAGKTVREIFWATWSWASPG